MRLLILGSLGGQLGAATKIAMDKGAKVAHANSVDQGLSELRQGRGADLIMCDVALDIGLLVRSLATERICTPVVACGIGTDARRASNDESEAVKAADAEINAESLTGEEIEIKSTVHAETQRQDREAPGSKITCRHAS